VEPTILDHSQPQDRPFASRFVRIARDRLWLLLVLGLLLFIRTRALYQASIIQSTVYRSAQIGLEWRIARATGQDFYHFHTAVNQQLTQRLPLEQRPLMADLNRIEYPPLAVLWMALPTYFLPAPAPNLFEQKDDVIDAMFQSYSKVYIRIMIGVDLLICAVLIILSFRINFPGESKTSWIRPLAVYILCTRLMDEMTYTRMDLAVGLLLILGFLALLTSAPTLISYLVLALAINFRITPLIWTPLFALASISLGRPILRRTIVSLTWRCALIALLSLGLFVALAYYLGPGSLDFARYHVQRGLHIESLPGSLFMLYQSLGGDAHTTFSHGAYDVVSPLAMHLAAFTPWFTAILLAIAYAVGAQSIRTTRTDPLAFASLALLITIAALLGSPVFSPQYLLWIVPLAGLLPARNKLETATLFTLVAVFALTFVLYTRLYYTDLVPMRLSPDHKWIYMRPHLRGTLLLLLRNALLILAAAGLAIKLRRQGRSDSPPPLPPDRLPTTAAPIPR